MSGRAKIARKILTRGPKLVKKFVRRTRKAVRTAGRIAETILHPGATHTRRKKKNKKKKNMSRANGSYTTVVRGREYVNSVRSTTSFYNQTYLLNPGNKDLFPWLSTQALGYQKYRFRKLNVEYVSTSGSISTTAALGSVVLATQYDVWDNAFMSKRDAEVASGSVVTVPSKNITHHVQQSSNMISVPYKFVNPSYASTPVPEPLLTFAGLLNIITDGNPSDGQGIGEIWVDYEVEFVLRASPPLVSAREDVLVKCDWGANNPPMTISPLDMTHVTKATGAVSWGWERSPNLTQGTATASFHRQGIFQVEMHSMAFNNGVLADGILFTAAAAAYGGITLVPCYSGFHGPVYTWPNPTQAQTAIDLAGADRSTTWSCLISVPPSAVVPPGQVDINRCLQVPAWRATSNANSLYMHVTLTVTYVGQLGTYPIIYQQPYSTPIPSYLGDSPTKEEDTDDDDAKRRNKADQEPGGYVLPDIRELHISSSSSSRPRKG